jgi:hypothetical protein
MLAIIDGSWYVLEVSAITNSTRTTARWEVVYSNFDQSTGTPVCGTSTVSSGLVNEAKSTAGPFAGSISASSITNIPVYNSQNAVTGCRLTISVADQPLESLVHIGAATISSTFTAYAN